jgi:hypothetical protein
MLNLAKKESKKMTKELSIIDDLKPMDLFVSPKNADEILEKIEFTNQADHWSLKIDRRFYDVISEIVQKSASEFSGIKLQSFFQDSSGKIFEKTKFSIEISEDDIKTAIEKVLAHIIEYRQSLASFGIKKIERSDNNNEILFYPEKEAEIYDYKNMVLLDFVAGVVTFSFSDITIVSCIFPVNCCI